MPAHAYDSLNNASAQHLQKKKKSVYHANSTSLTTRNSLLSDVRAISIEFVLYFFVSSSCRLRGELSGYTQCRKLDPKMMTQARFSSQQATHVLAQNTALLFTYTAERRAQECRGRAALSVEPEPGFPYVARALQELGAHSLEVSAVSICSQQAKPTRS